MRKKAVFAWAVLMVICLWGCASSEQRAVRNEETASRSEQLAGSDIQDVATGNEISVVE